VIRLKKREMRGLEVYLLKVNVRCNVVIVKFSQVGCKGSNKDFLFFFFFRH
jgi:hypothetical protein